MYFNVMCTLCELNTIVWFGSLFQEENLKAYNFWYFSFMKRAVKN